MRIDNEVFWPDVAAGRAPRIRPRYVYLEEDFYATPRPVTEPGWVVRAAARPFGFGAILFGLGWLGILLQLGFFRQLVVGAPVFEEAAKFGLALCVVAILGGTRHWARLPWAWISGAAFGVFEHFVSYSEEPAAILAGRIAFHAGSTGLSMAIFTILEPSPDVRGRWLSTMTSTVLHWANNFSALVFAFAAAALPYMDTIGTALSAAIAVGTFALTFLALASAGRLRERLGGLADLLLPRLVEPQSLAAARERDTPP